MCLDQGPSRRQRGWSQPINEAQEKVLVNQSSNILVTAKDRFGSFADKNSATHLRPVSGVKRTSNVRFQGPTANPAGAADVTNMWGVGHGFGGHGFAGAIVACGVETRGLCSWVCLLWLRRRCRGFGLWFVFWICSLMAQLTIPKTSRREAESLSSVTSMYLGSL
jgi:hypothetical protein